MEDILLHHHSVHRIELNVWRHSFVTELFLFEEGRRYFVMANNHQLTGEVHRRNIYEFNFRNVRMKQKSHCKRARLAIANA